MNRFKIVFLILFIITITIVTTILILVDEESIMAQEQEQGVTPIDPENITNQTLQGYPTKDKYMSTGIENE